MVKKNILSLITALVILYLSFARADTFNKVNILNFRNLDKVVHMCMYFGLMIALLYENRSAVKSTRSIFLLAIIPFTYGTLIEFFQSWLTVTRKGDFFDAVFNLIGIFLALIAWKLFQKFSKKEN
ncbi:MAG TPA: VanZ family protein [Ignavibacteria bacterium]